MIYCTHVFTYFSSLGFSGQNISWHAGFFFKQQRATKRLQKSFFLHQIIKSYRKIKSKSEKIAILGWKKKCAANTQFVVDIIFCTPKSTCCQKGYEKNQIFREKWEKMDQKFVPH